MMMELICNGNLGYGVKHPIMLPKGCHLVQLIIKHCHELVQHQSNDFILGKLRKHGYWIIGGGTVVASFLT
jgi:hypothetical protein